MAFGFYHVHFLLKLSIYTAAFISYAVVIAPLLAYICEVTDECSTCNCQHNVTNTSYLTHLLYLLSIIMVLHATDRQVGLGSLPSRWMCFNRHWFQNHFRSNSSGGWTTPGSGD